MSFVRGDFVTLNGKPCVVTAIAGDQNVPEDHLAVWYGSVDDIGCPEVWTVPAEYFEALTQPLAYHH